MFLCFISKNNNKPLQFLHVQFLALPPPLPSCDIGVRLLVLSFTQKNNKVISYVWLYRRTLIQLWPKNIIKCECKVELIVESFLSPTATRLLAQLLSSLQVATSSGAKRHFQASVSLLISVIKLCELACYKYCTDLCLMLLLGTESI